MSLSVRTENLRKVFQSPPPAASAGPDGGRALPKGKSEVVALDGVSLEVEPGEIFALLGPNGAGKSTTIGILTTRILPTEGSAWIGDRNVLRDPVAVKRLIGVVPQKPNLDVALTAREILLFHGAYFGLAAAERTARAQALLDEFQLNDRADQLVRGFSGGMMQRLSIARALMHDPAVLFLDEPSAGLDPQTRLLLWGLVREYSKAGKTIIVTTHYMEEADALCRRLAIIDHGRLIALGTSAELKSSIPGGYLIRLRFDAPGEPIRAALAALPGVSEVKSTGETALDLYADRGGPLVGPIVNLATGAGLGVLDVHIAEPSLENLFFHHTGRSLRE